MSDSTKQMNNQSRLDQVPSKELPPGVKLLRTFEGHEKIVLSLAFDPEGWILASGSKDKTVKLWEVTTGNQRLAFQGSNTGVWTAEFDPRGATIATAGEEAVIEIREVASGKLLRSWRAHQDAISSILFDSEGKKLASGSYDRTVKIWNPESGKLLHTLKSHTDSVNQIMLDGNGKLASGSSDRTVKLWDIGNGKLLHTLKGHKRSVFGVAFKPGDCLLASGGDDKTVRIWDARNGRLIRTLEAHTSGVHHVAFSFDGRLLASKSSHSIRLWNCETWETVAVIPEEATDGAWITMLAFHPKLPLLVSNGSERANENKQGSAIHLWELDTELLLGHRRADDAPSVSYTSAKVVLLGDSGVGKTGLGWRMAHGDFREHSSTHGQQFWLLKELSMEREDGTQCEAVLWDLAGQPDYRLIHALFVDDADLALILFDPTRDGDPLSGVEFWLKQLRGASVRHACFRRIPAPLDGNTITGSETPVVLVAARSDRGEARLTREALEAFCLKRGIREYHVTSAFKGEGVAKLVTSMKQLIEWDEKPSTVTTETFKKIKDFVLNLKEGATCDQAILTPQQLRERLERIPGNWQFTDSEMLTALDHLANHGYVAKLKTSTGDLRLLLAPELLNNLAASFILEARRNPKGLGSLEEERLSTGAYKFPELETLSSEESAILIDSATVMFLEHNVCFRETDLAGRTYLVFPELINLRRPLEEEKKLIEDGAAYTVSGAIRNVYASLVALMGYTQTFTRTDQWQNQARYEVGNGQVCGFRLEAERDGELDLVLYFGKDTDVLARTLFQSLFENFLARRNVTVQRFEPVACSKGHTLNRAVVREQLSADREFSFCNQCGEKIVLPKFNQTIQLTTAQEAEVEANRRAADQRSLFEQVLFRLKTYATELKIASPSCFVSYAWGNPEQERWVEKSLASDLQKAGVSVVLDRWENARIGASVPRFVERVGECDRVLVVGTPLYRIKYDNNEPMRGFVAAAEGDLIGERMVGTEEEKQKILPLLLDGEKETSFPRLLHPRVYADFRKPENYFATALDVILSIYGIGTRDAVAVELRESLVNRPQG